MAVNNHPSKEGSLKSVFTAETQRTLSSIYIFFAAETPAKKMPSRTSKVCCGYYGRVFQCDISPCIYGVHAESFTFLASQQKGKFWFSLRALRLERSGR